MATPVRGGLPVGRRLGAPAPADRDRETQVAALTRPLEPSVVAISTLPESVTTPIALAIGTQTGGTAGLTVVSVIVAGIAGAAFGPALTTRVGVHDAGARGLEMGAASHALGTARIGEESDAAPAHAWVAIVNCGMVTALLVPMVARLLCA